MKPERLEELTDSLADALLNRGCVILPDDWPVISAALLAVERETVERTKERCAEVCDSVDNFANPMTAGDCAAAIRSLLTEET